MNKFLSFEIEKVRNGYILTNGDCFVFDSFKLMLENLNNMLALHFLEGTDVKVHISIEEMRDETKKPV